MAAAPDRLPLCRSPERTPVLDPDHGMRRPKVLASPRNGVVAPQEAEVASLIWYGVVVIEMAIVAGGVAYGAAQQRDHTRHRRGR